jgi:hypothetical protein
MSPVPSNDVVPHQVAPAMLEQPAMICCKPSRPLLLLPQVPSIDVVPHRTGDCTNASRRGPLQVDEITTERRPLATNKKAAPSTLRETTPCLTVARPNCRNSRSNHGSVLESPQPKLVSTPGRVRRRGRRSRSSAMDRVFTQRPRCDEGVAPK